MSKGCYINGTGCISAQPLTESGFLAEAVITNDQNVMYAKEPSYKEMIPPAMIRRMAKGVKMGIFASTTALKEANLDVPEAIITGTGMGCMEDSEKFLKAILNNKEEFLTPTSFIQSTHNTVAGQIALGLKCTGYNFTYVNGSVSFESALMDAQLQIETGEANSVLVGGMDETAQHTIDLLKLVDIVKKEADQPYEILNSSSEGIVLSEGAAFFVLENEQKENTYARFEAVAMMNVLNVDEVEGFINDFLVSNGIEAKAIDAVVLGNNGDKTYDHYYQPAMSMFSETPQVYYKHLSGEHNTASAYGFWVAANILKNQEIPVVVKMNAVEGKAYNYVLLYNQYLGKDHSLTLLKKC